MPSLVVRSGPLADAAVPMDVLQVEHPQSAPCLKSDFSEKGLPKLFDDMIHLLLWLTQNMWHPAIRGKTDTDFFGKIQATVKTQYFV
jgi:hypothetical protein